MTTRVAIHQPNYAPWCGYFAKLLTADVFVWLDDVQLPLGRSYVSRTRVLGPKGPLWLSIPVERHREQRIDEVRIAPSSSWSRKHLGTLRATYARALHFDQVWTLIEPLYANPSECLAPFNQRLIEVIASYLDIDLPARRMHRASAFNLKSHGDQRLIELVQAVGGDTYLSGPGGLHYQDPARFVSAGLQLELRAYVPIPYAQNLPVGSQFVPGLSILDALFHLGKQARDLLIYSA